MNADNVDARGGVAGKAAGSFTALYEKYLPGVFQYVNYRVGDRSTAEDLTSDIFSKALTGFGRYDAGKAAFSTWIFSIARNTLTDYYRKRAAMRKLQEEADPDVRAASLSPEEEASRSDEIHKLHECLVLLKPKEQELISLKFGGGMTNREIAKITGLSESNVGTILCRAIRKLRDSFSEWRK